LEKAILRPDLVVGLVGAAGTDLSSIKQQIKAQFASFDYEYHEVKISGLISGISNLATGDLPEDERITRLMDAGDRIREIYKGGDGVVSLAVTAIRKLKRDRDDGNGVWRPIVFVLDSLKNPLEVETLEAVYGKNLYIVSVYSNLEERVTRLTNRIAETCTTSVKSSHRERAEKVIFDDEKRGKTNLSQDVRNTFPAADFFVELGPDTDGRIKRCVDLIFGEPFLTPTINEYSMYLAKAAAFRSDDLSRQVGAIIVGSEGEVISSGCNEVPYPGGGMFTDETSGPDNRDYTVEFDPNSSEITNSLIEVVDAFKSANLLVSSNRTAEEITTELMHGELKEHIGDARLKNLIEFGRVVHAEMHAITGAARLGRSTKSAKLYCTTFPCHICARHIIAAGISEVHFIEPYPKSLTKTLYKREIKADGVSGDLPKPVEFKPFQGIAPKFYQRVFTYRPRKSKTGTILHLNRSAAVPLGATVRLANAALEESLSGRVDEIRDKLSVSETGG
jgi:deoxycytidylate deaminase